MLCAMAFDQSVWKCKKKNDYIYCYERLKGREKYIYMYYVISNIDLMRRYAF